MWRQPRLKKEHRHLVDRPVTVSVFFCDVDLPHGGVWTDGLAAEAIARYDQLHVLKTAGIYHTRGGLRVVQPLEQPLPVPESEVYHRRWLLELEAAGLQVDWACKDWTRLFRLPHVRRDGRPFRSPYVNLNRMAAIELEPIQLADLAQPPRSPRRTYASQPHVRPAVVPWSTSVPPVWQPRVERLARAVREVATEWHTLFLALAGAMISKDVPYEHVPLLCRAISVATGNDTRTESREAGARSTVERYLRGHAVTGLSRLRKEWPGVAAALSDVLAGPRAAKLRTDSLEQARAPVPLDRLHALAAFEDALRSAPPLLSIAGSDSGLGKLGAVANVAAERAAKPYSSPAATGAHAPPGSRTSIAMASNVLAQAMVDELRSNEVLTQHLRGPLSFRNSDGSPVCKFYDVAKPLVEGGQIMQKELCEGRGRDPCEHYQTCPARHGIDGPDEARVVVGSHAVIGPLERTAGKTGLLIIDEVPELLEPVTITLEDLAMASSAVDIFVGAYGTALRPAVMALTAWAVSLARMYEPTSAVAAVEAGADAVLPEELTFALRAVELDSGTAVDCARAAPLPGNFGDAPPLMFHEIRRAKASTAYARKIGNASRVLQLIHRALVRPEDFTFEVVHKDDEREIRVAAVKTRMVAALKREGATVILAEGVIVPQYPIVAKLVGYEPPLRILRVSDAAPIARTMIRTAAASRRRWAPAGQLVLDPSLVTAVKAIVDWAREHPSTRRLAIVTFAAVALGLEAAIAGPDALAVRARWLAAGQYEPALQQILDRLGPILRTWTAREWQSESPRELVVSAYEDTARLAAIRDVDALVTLGDPWPGRAAPDATAAFLRAPGAKEARGEAECRSQLEAAHARLEPFERTRPGRALHVGAVLPGGSGWAAGRVEIQQHLGGRPRADTSMSVDELNAAIERLGGMSAAARALGCPRSTLRRYSDGECSVPQVIGERVRHLVRGSGLN